MPGGKYCDSSAILALIPVGGVEGVGARLLADGEDGGRAARCSWPSMSGSSVPSSVRPMSFTRTTEPSGLVRRGMAANSSGRHQERLDEDGGVEPLARHRRGAAELAGGDLDVVGAHRRHDVVRGHPVLGELVRVEPDPHGVGGAEDLDLADARHAGEDGLDLRHGVVVEVGRAHAAVLGGEADDDQVVPGGLADRDAPALHHVRERRQGELELVLHLGPGEVRIGARGEGERDRRAARRVGRGVHVEHPVETRHLLLDHLDDAVLDGLRRGARVGGADGDRGRGDRRVLGDRAGCRWRGRRPASSRWR